VKNCDLGLENAALGLRPRAALSRPRSQFFTIRTSQPTNNIHFFAQCEKNITYFLTTTFFNAKKKMAENAGFQNFNLFSLALGLSTLI